MNFFHNKIANPVGNGTSFDEWLEQQFGAKKTASDTKDKTEPDNETKQCVNNDNEENAHSYQEGESVHGKKSKNNDTDTDKEATSSAKVKVKEAKCGKEMGESNNAGQVTGDHTEAGPGNDENPEPKVLINNDPNYQKGESTDPSKAKGNNKKQPGKPVVGKSASNARFKKVSSMNRKEKIALFATLSAQKHPIEYVEAMVGMKFANMTSEEKEWFKKFWTILYPAEYVEQMVADR